MPAFLLGLWPSISKYVIIAGAVAFLCLSVFLWYDHKISQAKAEATAAFNAAQMVQVVKEKQAALDKLTIIQTQLETEMAINDKLNQQVKDMEASANTVIDKSGDTNFDPLFNDVLKGLKGTK